MSTNTHEENLFPEVPIVKDMPPDRAVQAMITWFSSFYDNPIHQSAWNDSSLISARNAIERAFMHQAEPGLINAAVGEIETDGVLMWAPSEKHPAYLKAVAEAEAELEWLRQHDPSHIFQEAISDVESFVSNELREDYDGFENRMVYTQVWSVLEAFLLDFLLKRVEAEPQTLERLWTKDPHFKQISAKQPELGSDEQQRRRKVSNTLRHTSFHNIPKAKRLYRNAFEIDFDQAFERLNDFLHRRHDCVHRNGQSMTGEDSTPSRSEIKQLIEASRCLVQSINYQLDS